VSARPAPGTGPAVARAHALAAAAAGALLHLLVQGGALAGAEPWVRLTLAFVARVLVPGAGLAALLGPPPGGAWLAGGWAFGFGVAWNAAWVLALHAAGRPFTDALAWGPLTAALPWLLCAGWPRPAAGGAALDRRVAVAVLLAAAFACLHNARFGPAMGLSSDSPDHIGTLRRMLESGALFPQDAFFRDAGPLGADPRKGVWHAEVALLTRAARLDPVESWTLLTALVVPFLVLNTAALGFLVRGSTGAAIAAWAVVLTYGASLAQSPIRQAVFGSRVGDQLAVATTVAVLADLGARGARTRLAAVVLGFGAAAAHVFSGIHFALVFGALGLGLLVRDRRVGPVARRLVLTVVAVAAACGPLLAFRAAQSYGRPNVIHAEPQGLLWLADGVPVVSFGQLWAWMGPAWVLVPLAWPLLWRRARAHTPALFLLTTSVAVLGLMYNPLAVGPLVPRVGYLLMRLIWLVPFAALLAWLLPELLASLRASRTAAGRVVWAAALGMAAVTLAPALFDAVAAVRTPQVVVGADRAADARRWSDAFDGLRRGLGPGAVVLSDPATSYAIPMLTGLHVVTLVDQHASPNDTLALDRILDARDALDPHATWDRTRAVVRRFGVTAIALNDRFTSVPRLDYWAPNPRWFRAARARLDAHPEAFEPVHDTGDFVAYRVRPAALDTLSAPPSPRPYVESWRPGRHPVGRALGPRLPVLLGARFAPRVAAPGDTVRGVILWRAPERLPAGSYTAAVRFDRALPGGAEPPAWARKPVRKLLERARGERYRFRADHLPTDGAYGVDLWRADEVVHDSVTVMVPRDVADGDYRIEVGLRREPHLGNLHLRDYFSDRDRFSGPAVGRLAVRRARGADGGGDVRH
jgi:hypothetical protein